MKKVAFVIESLNLGGAETSLVTLLNNLSLENYKVDLILFSKKNLFIEYVPKSINIIYIDYPKVNIFERVKYFILKKLNHRKQHTAQYFWNIIKDKFSIIDKNYDVVHAYNQGFVTYYVSKYIIAKNKYAWINIDYQMAGYNIVFDYPFYKSYKEVIVISDEVQRGFEVELNSIGKKIENKIVRLFSDEKILNIQGKKKQEIAFDTSKVNIVTVCRLTKQKGLHLAIESCKILIDRGYRINWSVIGEGVERDYLTDLIYKNNLNNNFFLLGFTNNPFPYMINADIYVQTSIFEGWGLTIIEAGLLLKPIVTTNFPTALEIYTDEETALIAEMNPESIANQIERLLTDETLKNKLITNLSQRTNTDKQKSLAQIEEMLGRD